MSYLDAYEIDFSLGGPIPKYRATTLAELAKKVDPCLETSPKTFTVGIWQLRLERTSRKQKKPPFKKDSDIEDFSIEPSGLKLLVYGFVPQKMTVRDWDTI